MLFERIVCGVDGSEAGFVALAQARRLLAPGARLVAVTACEDAVAAHAGMGAPRVAAELRAEAAATRLRAERELGDLARSAAVVARGRPIEVLRHTSEREQADLLVVGSHGTGRALGALLGSVATAMLHEAPCPVLVARPTRGADPFPRRIAVGVDGSPQAAEAERVAAALARRLDATLHVVAALGGKHVDLDHLGDSALADPREPVQALQAASDDADLLVLGSRGLHGVASLGSVGERVAHRARCSVLVLRPGRSPAAAVLEHAAVTG